MLQEILAFCYCTRKSLGSASFTTGGGFHFPVSASPSGVKQRAANRQGYPADPHPGHVL